MSLLILLFARGKLFTFSTVLSYRGGAILISRTTFISQGRQSRDSSKMFFFDADVVHLLGSVAMVRKLSPLARTVTSSVLWYMSWGMWLASGMSTHGPTVMTTFRSYVRT
jgi:hypothetical protein